MDVEPVTVTVLLPVTVLVPATIVTEVVEIGVLNPVNVSSRIASVDMLPTLP